MYTPVPVSRLRKLVTVEQPGATTVGAGGQIERSYSTLATVFASIEPINAREYFQAEQVHSEITHRITLRYLNGISPKCRIVFGSRTFDVEAVLNTDERNYQHTLLCKELPDG